MNEVYSVIFDKDRLVAVFFYLGLAKDYAKFHHSQLGGKFRLRVMGGATCFYDSNDN